MSRFVLNIALAGAILAHGQTNMQQAQEQAPSEILDGLDPVLLAKGEEVFGKANLTVVRGRFEYLFATPETRDAFEQNPEAYEVQNGGLCQRMGGATSGSPNIYTVHEGRIYLFGTEECRKLFLANPKRYFAPPVPALPGDEAAATRAAALIVRAAEAMGGASAVDAVQTYVERGTYVDQGPMGERTVTEIVTRRPPDALRIERTFTMGGRTITGASVATADEAFYISQKRAYPVMEAGRPSLTIQLMRHPVMLLRARCDPQFKAAALGVAPLPGGAGDKAGAAAVERVGVRVAGVAATIGIDPETGRVLSLSYVDRDPQGRYGEIVTVYTDFRRVSGGLTLPFAARAFVDGTPEPALARTWSVIDVNTLLDASVFTRPPAPPGPR
jgi:YHS domain-containing protein